MLLPLSQPPALHQAPSALLITGAAVWQDDGRRGTVENGWAVLVQGGRVAAVGPEVPLRRSHPKAQEVHLKGGTLLPGLIEGHAHVQGLGALRHKTDLTNAGSLSDALRKVRRWMGANPDGWVIGRGWDQNRWPSRAFPTAADLDNVTGDRPAVLTRVDGHAVWVNAAALRLAGITRDTRDPAGGRILRDADGEPTGILVDTATTLVEKLIPAPSRAEVEARLLEGLEELKAYGFTAVADMGIEAPALAAYRSLDARNALPIRVFAYLSHDRALMLKELTQRGSRESFFRIQGVKFYLDGALGSRGARLLEPYADAPETAGLWVTDPAKVEADVAVTLASGFQPAIHAIGDAANRTALDLLERTRRKAPRNGPMPRIEHAQIVTDKDAARFGPLGVVASVQPVHCTSDHAWTPARLGPARTREAYPWRRFLQGGATLAFGSDAPVEDANPYVALAAAETREDPAGEPEGGFLPDQKLARVEALRAYTAGNAKALQRSALGAIRPGAAADLLWVEAPILTLAPEALRKLRPARLWVNGREVEPGRR
ncbi:MAG: amidohydrolase [Holophagaceae bacterium]|nr:amidohydrolase [Holophagaceae bacterium]